MRETTRSLSFWFILSGMSAALMSVTTFMLLGRWTHGFSLFSTVVSALLLAVALGQLFVGTRLAELLREKPHIPLRITWAGLILSFPRFNLVGIMLDLYILHQLKRLAREADFKQEKRVLR